MILPEDGGVEMAGGPGVRVRVWFRQGKGVSWDISNGIMFSFEKSEDT